MNSPIVSVIIPAFNAENYIGEAISSVLNQDFKDYEIIVINDGSTDQTVRIVSDFSDYRINLINQPNSGISKARNRGIEESKGQYIAFLDADDTWFPNKLSLLVSFLNNNQEYAMVYSRGELIDSNGQLIGFFPYKGFEGNILKKLLLNASLIHSSSILIQKNILDSYKGFDSNINHYEDWDLWLRIAARYKIGFLKDVLLKIRINKEGNTARTMNDESKLYDVLYIANRIFQISGFPISLKPLKRQVISYVYKMEGFRNMHFHQMKKARQLFIQSIKSYALNPELYFAVIYTLIGARISNFIHQNLWHSIKKTFWKFNS